MVSIHASEKTQKERAYVNSAYPLVVAVLPDVPEEHRELLRSQGCVVREIEPVYPPGNQDAYARAYYIINYSKLRIWNFKEYSKMLYLDADIQVFGNIDDLFDLPEWRKSRGRTRYNLHLLLHTSTPVCLCLSLAKPSTCESLLKTLQVTPPTPFAEQDFLKRFFGKDFKPVSPVYNLILDGSAYGSVTEAIVVDFEMVSFKSAPDDAKAQTESDYFKTSQAADGAAGDDAKSYLVFNSLILNFSTTLHLG
ncbi:unnamed protein product [Microthlaspi erraticum]|uniref:Hexosyltransferase n=1 Tax=Microthlaspi erraticum TaxID=1685480 RepID=A0A6D2HUU5_9BRAS|nr:unnamed protein product [Microthlaspi erraticum]